VTCGDVLKRVLSRRLVTSCYSLFRSVSGTIADQLRTNCGPLIDHRAVYMYP